MQKEESCEKQERIQGNKPLFPTKEVHFKVNKALLPLPPIQFLTG